MTERYYNDQDAAYPSNSFDEYQHSQDNEVISEGGDEIVHECQDKVGVDDLNHIVKNIYNTIGKTDYSFTWKINDLFTKLERIYDRINALEAANAAAHHSSDLLAAENIKLKDRIELLEATGDEF
jgi:uncharacterized FAD-dependent dehydrogenase